MFPDIYIHIHEYVCISVSRLLSSLVSLRTRPCFVCVCVCVFFSLYLSFVRSTFFFLYMQLKTVGWMHHLARHSVACFLTRGDCYVSWERGRAVFDKYLLDADVALNNANWQWLSASAFFHKYFRVYSPIAFGKQYDKSGSFIRTFLPALRHMPDKYIYEPWTAPLDVQKHAKCIIGKDYPAPIVDHATIHKINIGRMAAAYQAGKAAGMSTATKTPPATKKKATATATATNKTTTKGMNGSAGGKKKEKEKEKGKGKGKEKEKEESGADSESGWSSGSETEDESSSVASETETDEEDVS